MKHIVHPIADDACLVQLGTDDEPENDQDVKFMGVNAESRARSFAAWLNSKDRSGSDLADIPTRIFIPPAQQERSKNDG